jgi:hypothetical protein
MSALLNLHTKHQGQIEGALTVTNQLAFALRGWQT